MSRKGRGHKGGAHDEGHADERWLVSYADMITVLMCLFLVLFAMSFVGSGTAGTSPLARLRRPRADRKEPAA